MVVKMAALSHTHLMQYALQCPVDVTNCLVEVSATSQLTVILNIQVAFVKSASHFITTVQLYQNLHGKQRTNQNYTQDILVNSQNCSGLH